MESDNQSADQEENSTSNTSSVFVWHFPSALSSTWRNGQCEVLNLPKWLYVSQEAPKGLGPASLQTRKKKQKKKTTQAMFFVCLPFNQSVARLANVRRLQLTGGPGQVGLEQSGKRQTRRTTNPCGRTVWSKIHSRNGRFLIGNHHKPADSPMRLKGLAFVMASSPSMSRCRSLSRTQLSTEADISSTTVQLYNLETSREGVKNNTSVI